MGLSMSNPEAKIVSNTLGNRQRNQEIKISNIEDAENENNEGSKLPPI